MEPSSTAASASAWSWHAEYGLFYSPARGLWAQYDAATGEYSYLPPATVEPAAAAAAAAAGPSPQDADDKEEGELSDDGGPTLAEVAWQPQTYDDPSLYAFPSDDGGAAGGGAADDGGRPSSLAHPQAFLRLVSLGSSCLPPGQKLATLSSHQPDGYALGRDRQVGADEGRIRLREMEVSKTHAIIFYEPPEATAGPADDDGGWGAAYVDRDAEEAPLASTSPDAKVEPRGTWAIVDLGSTHGTFFKRPAEGGSSKGKGERLSEPKVASLPRVLEHGDEVRVGGTTFKVHLHAGLPCDGCSLSSAAALIPTSLHPFAPRDGSASPMSKGPAPLHDPFAGLTSRERLYRLRADMLRTTAAAQRSMTPAKRTAAAAADGVDDAEGEDSQDGDGPQARKLAYMDRAAARRAVHPSFPAVGGSSSGGRQPAAQAVIAAAAVPAQDARMPIPTTNIGHTLLLKHGWAPGQALGRAEDGRVDPVEVKRAAGEGKRGLGMKSVAVPASAVDGGEEKASWRDEGREKRWREMGLLK